MSETVNQSEWDGVYYDRQSGEFFIFDVQDEEVVFIEAFTGDEYETLGVAEFKDCARDGDFGEVSPSVLQDPEETVQKLIYEALNAVSGGSTSFSMFSPVDADFAVTATNLEEEYSRAPYMDKV